MNRDEAILASEALETYAEVLQQSVITLNATTANHDAITYIRRIQARARDLSSKLLKKQFFLHDPNADDDVKFAKDFEGLAVLGNRKLK